MAQPIDGIENQVQLDWPIARVWRALTEYREFGKWFGVNLQDAFCAGRTSRGRIMHPGYDHLQLELAVQSLETERLFSFHWHPYAVDPKVDYPSEQPTLNAHRRLG